MPPVHDAMSELRQCDFHGGLDYFSRAAIVSYGLLLFTFESIYKMAVTTILNLDNLVIRVKQISKEKYRTHAVVSMDSGDDIRLSIVLYEYTFTDEFDTLDGKVIVVCSPSGHIEY